MAIHKLRERFGELVKSEIEQTVGDPATLRKEPRYLVDALYDPRVKHKCSRAIGAAIKIFCNSIRRLPQ